MNKKIKNKLNMVFDKVNNDLDDCKKFISTCPFSEVQISVLFEDVDEISELLAALKSNMKWEIRQQEILKEAEKGYREENVY